MKKSKADRIVESLINESIDLPDLPPNWSRGHFEGQYRRVLARVSFIPMRSARGASGQSAEFGVDVVGSITGMRVISIGNIRGTSSQARMAANDLIKGALSRVGYTIEGNTAYGRYFRATHDPSSASRDFKAFLISIEHDATMFLSTLRQFGTVTLR